MTKQTQGTKFSAHYKLRVDGGKSATVRCRLVFRASKAAVVKADLGKEFDDIFERRIEEANSFYDKVEHEQNTNHSDVLPKFQFSVTDGQGQNDSKETK